MLKEQFCQELHKLANPQKKVTLQKFFKTGKGQYAEGDIFIGVTVPETRALVKKYIHEFNTSHALELLHSPIHEERLAGLYVLIALYKKAGTKEKAKIFKTYLKNSSYINNWDLVDTSAPSIVGNHLLFVSKSLRLKFLKDKASSKLLWDRRIAVVACLPLIKNGDFKEIFELSKLLFKDKEDLMHKAVGWMLREVGKKDEESLKQFLIVHASKMPRTSLRYAIEKFPSSMRKKFLKIKIS